MPGCSAMLGKRSPQSMIRLRPPYSTTVKFLPISPTPPKGVMARVLRSGGTSVSTRAEGPLKRSLTI